MLWLAERTALNRSVTCVFWAVGLGLWIAGFVALRNQAAPWYCVLGAVYALHAAVKCWIAWEASRRFADDRRNGALELLLTTPLGERRVLAGWLAGLIRRFYGPALMLLAVDLHLWWSSGRGDWSLWMLAVTGQLVADGYTLCWVGLWQGLKARSATAAFVRAVGQVLVLPWFAVLAVLGIWGMLADRIGSPANLAWLAVTWFLVGYVMDFALCAWAVHKLGKDIRWVASQPVGRPRFAAAGPRLKPVSSWNFTPLEPAHSAPDVHPVGSTSSDHLVRAHENRAPQTL